MKPVFVMALALVVLAACGPAPRRTAEEIAAANGAHTLDGRDPVVAQVDGSVIRLSDIAREAPTDPDGGVIEPPAPGTPEFEMLVNELIDQRLLAMEARRRGLDQSDEVVRRMALAEERILGNVLVETALADAVNDETIQRIYEEQVQLIPLGEEVRARHILVDTREEAEAIKVLVDAGQDFATLAVRMSQDQATRLEGGDLGYFSREGVLPAFGAVAFATPEGVTSEPFQSEFGWHILQVVDRRREPAPTLEQLRPNIVRFYTFDQLEGLIEGLRSAAVIERTDFAPGGIMLGVEGALSAQDDPATADEAAASPDEPE